MSDQQPQRPATDDDGNARITYWPWRTEPEIPEQRQQELSTWRAIQPDFKHDVYPFRGVQLTRADVEWLLATHHDNGIKGPVDLSDARQYERNGLDLRGAYLCGQDLSGLPLARLCGGVTRQQSLPASMHQREAAAVHLEDATLTDTCLQDACLRGAHLERAYLRNAHLEGSALSVAHLEGATLQSAHLEGSILGQVQPHEKGLASTSSVLQRRRKKGSVLTLPPADVHFAFFDNATSLQDAIVGNQEFGGIRLADVRWNDVNVARTSWRHVSVLGDEVVARHLLRSSGERKDKVRSLDEHATAVRAYRQLAIVLRSQGVNEDADRFAYRAQMLQRHLLVRQRHYVRAFGSWLLDCISGYGYKPVRSVLTYILVIFGYAVAYFALSNFTLAPFLTSQSSPLAWYEAIVLSISSFHGRGLFPTGLSLGDPVAIIAASEAIVGLLIEITFIATFTQRFFAK